MKANKHLMMNNDRAQAGIGTLIIFIAMVLVAAVAAAVLIQTSGVLQERAQSTGKQAAQEVSSNLLIKGIEGVRASGSGTTSETVDLLKVKVALNIGSSEIDLNQVVITVTDGDSINDLVYAGNSKAYGDAMTNFSSTASSAANMIVLATENTTDMGNNSRFFFTVEQIRDEDESFSQAEPIMNQGDLVNIYISTVSTTASAGSHTTLDEVALSGLKDSGITVSPRSTVNLILTPEAGSTTSAGFTSPSFGVRKSIALWP
ncbi:archaellin/type IV pilin N-terminal domain-containing protein [Methanococcoides burtonii]|uniref:Flagellin n=1 Tax=Methanococcoides burtonii (strain DSM 6242 / NBRC 107633 / OCM 468 / ACE-M) TaxID=259564 RepID=Q12ZK4_METBU|nr:archaellin/type IV pilin N-terminal domain-containing protein [Methanococcoides burtonii]ABE51122.1 flagellin [Methanococcoides burtonii DSM 6242]